jgi:hypothetical protein
MIEQSRSNASDIPLKAETKAAIIAFIAVIKTPLIGKTPKESRPTE